jgi:hypothetical protein
LSVGADCFNVFGWQQVTAVDQSWTYADARPLPNGTVAELKAGPLVSVGGVVPAGVIIPQTYINANFGHATAYQTPRTFRFLARFTF